MVIIRKLTKKTPETASIETIIKAQKFLNQEGHKMWEFIKANNNIKKGDKKTEKEVKKYYKQIVKDESIIVRLKICQSCINAGIEKFGENSLFIEIFKLGLLKIRRDALVSIKQIEPTDRIEMALDTKFIQKEINKVCKDIDKCQEKIDKFNLTRTICLSDLGEDVEDRLREVY